MTKTKTKTKTWKMKTQNRDSDSYHDCNRNCNRDRDSDSDSDNDRNCNRDCNCNRDRNRSIIALFILFNFINKKLIFLFIVYLYIFIYENFIMSYYKTIIKAGHDSILNGEFKFECKFAFFPIIYNENSEPCMSKNGPYKQFNNKVVIDPKGGILSVGIDYVKVWHSKFKNEDVLLGIYTLTGDNISDVHELHDGISKHTCILTPNTDINTSINIMEEDITEMFEDLSLKPLSLKEVKNKVETVQEETTSMNTYDKSNLFQLVFVIYIKKEAYDAYINYNNLESASSKIRSIYSFTKREIINNCPDNTGPISFIKDTILSAQTQALVNTAENEMFSLYTMI